jgi:hypothetical protein
MKTSQQTSIRRGFRVIQGVVGLLLAFLIIQSLIFWRVCDRGTSAVTGLEGEGLPSLRLLASLQDGLDIYRLHSYELMFAQDKDRPAKEHRDPATTEQTLSLRRRPPVCGHASNQF